MSSIGLAIGLILIGLSLWLFGHYRNIEHARQLKKLAKENYRLRHVVAELTLENHALSNSAFDKY